MKGFTLIEIIITLSIVSILTGISVPVYKIMQQKNNFKMAEFVIVSAVRRAQILAQAAKEDSSWGVHIENSQVTIFKGSDYIGRDISSDEKKFIASYISIGGLTEIIFNKLTGTPGLAGVITLLASNNSANITINEKGAIEY